MRLSPGPPPVDLTPEQARWWRELATAVELVGGYVAEDAGMFRRLVLNQTALDRALRTNDLAEIVDIGAVVLALGCHFRLTPLSRGALGDMDPGDDVDVPALQ